MPSKRELAEVAQVLDRLLQQLRVGEVTAPPSLVAKLEDAHRTVQALSEPERPGPTPRRVARKPLR